MGGLVKRLNRKNRNPSELELKSSGGIFDLLDNEVKSFLRVNDEEYDNFLNNLTDEQMEKFVDVTMVPSYKPTFAEKRELMRLYNLYT